MMRLFFAIIILTTVVGQAFSQNLLNERIRKISGRKRSIFLDSGIFHNGEVSVKSTLTSVRHSYKKSEGYERIVFDFSTPQPPKIYGYLSKNEKKIYLDLFKTSVQKGLKSFGNSVYVKKLDFLTFDDGMTSVEIELKNNSSADVFYLSSPARLVIDLKK